MIMNLVNSKLRITILKHSFLLFLFISSLSYPQKTFPTMTMSDINGEKINLNQLSANNILLISFWATWCNPCIDELETFNAIKNDLNIQNLLLPRLVLSHLNRSHFFLSIAQSFRRQRQSLTSFS